MRWMWIDRFTEFQSGRRAVAIKNVTLVSEEMDGYFAGNPVFPASLMVEGLAQTGGLLVAEQRQFEERVVLAKLGKALFRAPPVPGECLIYTAEIAEVNSQGAIVRGTAEVAGQLRAEVDLVFAHLDDRFPAQLFTDLDFIRILRVFRLFDVGRRPDGQPIEVPERFLRAEAVADEESLAGKRYQ